MRCAASCLGTGRASARVRQRVADALYSEGAASRPACPRHEQHDTSSTPGASLLPKQAMCLCNRCACSNAAGRLFEARPDGLLVRRRGRGNHNNIFTDT